MLALSIHKNNNSNSKQFLSSKKIRVSDTTDAILQISFRDFGLASIVENAIIDVILSNTPGNNDNYIGFSYILEKLNKYFRDMGKDAEFDGMNIFLGLIDNDTLHFSVLGSYFAYLVKNDKITNIAE